MSQDFTNETMLKMPYVPHPDMINGKAFGQLRTNGFNPFAPALANLSEVEGHSLGHILTSRGDDRDPLSLLEQSLAQGIDEAFIGRHNARIVFDQLFQELDVVGSSW